MTEYTSIEICAGAGGQALGLERAGFRHLALVENDPACCQTLRAVRRNVTWGVRAPWATADLGPTQARKHADGLAAPAGTGVPGDLARG